MCEEIGEQTDDPGPAKSSNPDWNVLSWLCYLGARSVPLLGFGKTASWIAVLLGIHGGTSGTFYGGTSGPYRRVS